NWRVCRAMPSATPCAACSGGAVPSWPIARPRCGWLVNFPRGIWPAGSTAGTCSGTTCAVSRAPALTMDTTRRSTRRTNRLRTEMAAQSSSPPAAEVSVVLCTYNRAARLADALTALVRQVEAPPYEVVVVDNNSTDDTPRVIAGFVAGGRVRYASEPVQGLSYARNRGVATARGDILAFTDDDVRVGQTWIRSIAQAFAEHPEA